MSVARALICPIGIASRSIVCIHVFPSGSDPSFGRAQLYANANNDYRCPAMRVHLSRDSSRVYTVASGLIDAGWQFAKAHHTECSLLRQRSALPLHRSTSLPPSVTYPACVHEYSSVCLFAH